MSYKKNDININSSSYIARVIFLCLCLAVSMPLMMTSAANNANASAVAKSTTANKTVLSKVMCNVFDIVTGTAGKTFAAFAIVSVGIGFFTGKVSWGLMIGVAAGIAAIFGAPSIVSAITGTDPVDCSDKGVFKAA